MAILGEDVEHRIRRAVERGRRLEMDDILALLRALEVRRPRSSEVYRELQSEIIGRGHVGMGGLS